MCDDGIEYNTRTVMWGGGLVIIKLGITSALEWMIL